MVGDVQGLGGLYLGGDGWSHRFCGFVRSRQIIYLVLWAG